MLLRKKEEIENWLNQYQIKNYELIKDKEYGYVVNVNGNVILSYKKLKCIEVKFNEIKGTFNCHFNELESLEGCPEIISKHFYCMNNLLKIKELKYLLKIKECGYIYLKNNKELGKLQDVSNFNQLKEKINIYFEKEDLLNIINKENLSINKIIKKI